MLPLSSGIRRLFGGSVFEFAVAEESEGPEAQVPRQFALGRATCLSRPVRKRQVTNTRRRTVQVLLVAAPAVFLAVMAWQHRWVGDDAFINFRIVKEMKAGNGPVFNAGERIEAGTSPLWLMVIFVADLALPLRLEWIAVLLGIGLTITGLVLAQRGAWLTWQDDHPNALFVPFGALFVVALPPMWDYATSGLETGLGIAWLGACFCGIGAAVPPISEQTGRRAARVPLWLCLLIGLGPLVRPDSGSTSLRSWRPRSS